jgi:ABC-2 type transport system permease protein
LLCQSDIITYRLMKISNILSRRNRILLRELVITDFKLRYQGSVLGYAWSLLKPLFLFAIMYVVFGLLVKLGSIEHYAVYLLFGIVLWNFFAEATGQGMASIVSRGDLLRKINFPKYIIVLSTINLTLNLVIVAILMVSNGVHLHMSALMLPVYIVELYVFALGLAFFLSALNVKYRDTGHIWDIIMQAAFYATPIIYPLSIVIAKSQTAAKFLLLNPIAQAIQDARYSLITHDTMTSIKLFSNFFYVFVPYLIVIIVFVGGVLYFRHNSKYFAENI